MTLTGNTALIDSRFDFPPDNPLELLQIWLQQAEKVGVRESKGFVLSTVSPSSIPSSRVVVLKGIDMKGIVFSTSRKSQKGQDIENNPNASGNIWWRESMQQVSFQGKVSQLSSEKSDEIFTKRTRQAKAVSSKSKQSQTLADEYELRQNIQNVLLENGDIPRPQDWFAYYLQIESIEFWHGSSDRFHKRLRYMLEDNVWQHQRLQP